MSGLLAEAARPGRFKAGEWRAPPTFTAGYRARKSRYGDLARGLAVTMATARWM